MRMKLSGARGLALALGAAIVLLQQWPAAQALLDWDRAAIAHGQWYRLLTAHLVHLNATHMAMNLVALLCLAELLWLDLPWRRALALLAASSLGVGLGLLWLAPDLWRYAGLSGVLHGAWAGSALLLLQDSDEQDRDLRPWWALALLLLAVKLTMENFYGLKLAQASLGAPVVLASHALGALSGLLFAGLAWLTKRRGVAPGPVASHPLFD